jgi:hypothetical protein
LTDPFSKGKFRWYDTIDSNPSTADDPVFWALEAVNQIPEWISGAAFDVQIDWADDRQEVRDVE